MLGATPAARAVEVLDARVERRADGYRVDFAVRLSAAPAGVERLITDYARFSELSPTVTSSRVVSGPAGADGGTRIELKLRPCVLVVFCRTVVKVSDAFVDGSRRRIEFIAVPALSDFHQAREVVVFEDVSTPDRPLVRFTYSAFLEPKFFVPPFVGPWLVKRHVIEDLKSTSERLERILQQENGGHE